MGHKVSEIVSKLAVSAFRKYNPNIKELWYDIEIAAIRTVKTKKSNIVNNIMFHLEKDFLYCTLPSGRKLAYHKPEILRIEKFNQMRDALSFMGVAIGKQYLRQTVWGGTLVENIVQATARDILAEAILRVDKAGYEVVLHVHDEIVAEVNDKNSSLNQFISLITALPAWAKGCPIAAKGWRGKRYKKE
jgi:DNA polymerase